MACQQLGRGLSHETDTEGKDHPLEGHLLRGGNTVDNPLGRLRARAVAVDLLYLDLVEVGHVLDESLTVIVVNGLWAQRVDVHGLAGDEVLDAPLDLWRTAGVVRTVPGSLALISHQRGAALRAALDERDGLGDDGALGDVDTHNLRDDLTAFLHVDVVADMQVERTDEVLVVQGGTLDGGAGQLHGIHIRHRGDGSRTAYLIGDLIQTGTHALGLELIGNGPARALGRETE